MRRGLGSLPRPVVWLGVALILLGVLTALVVLFIDEPLRRYMEREVNGRLDGYTVAIGKLDFHLLGFAIDFEEFTVVQDAHTDPPVGYFPKITASVHWRALLFGRLVADFRFDGPRLYVNRQHFKKEAEDPVPVEERGWQDALEAMYPLKINQFKIVDGEVTYVDEGPFKPLNVSQVNFTATNIRNIRSPERTYPSEVHLDGVVFDAGRVTADGQADFLAEPHLGVNATVALQGIELDYFKPITERYNLVVRKGTLSAEGRLEYAPAMKAADLSRVVVQDMDADYVHKAQTKGREKQVAKQAGDVAEKATTDEPGLLVRIAELAVEKSRVGFVNRASEPDYRVFMSDINLKVNDLSNRRVEGTSTIALKGKFMGTGATSATMTLRPDKDGPDFDIKVSIENTDMVGMNDLLRAHAKFDVVSGLFSFYSELAVRNRAMQGYVKPLFRDMQVYEKEQDKEKGLRRKIYEKVAGFIARRLENRPRDEVATRADISGKLENPQASAMEVVVNLIQNAFFKAILPGFEREAGRSRRADMKSRDWSLAKTATATRSLTVRN